MRPNWKRTQQESRTKVKNKECQQQKGKYLQASHPTKNKWCRRHNFLNTRVVYTTGTEFLIQLLALQLRNVKKELSILQSSQIQTNLYLEIHHL